MLRNKPKSKEYSLHKKKKKIRTACKQTQKGGGEKVSERRWTCTQGNQSLYSSSKKIIATKHEKSRTFYQHISLCFPCFKRWH